MTHRVYEGELIATDLKMAIVASRFNGIVVEKLVEGALAALRRHGAQMENQSVFWVPGAWEIPVVTERAASSGRFDAVICLGAVIRGSTLHFELVANGANNGIAHISNQSHIPITNGLVAADSLELAMDRAGGKVGNMGWNAAMAAIETSNVLKKISPSSAGR